MQEETEQGDQQWKTLLVFNCYRLCLSIVLIFLFYFDIGPHILDPKAANLYLGITIFYLGFSLISLIVARMKPISFTTQTCIQVFMDSLIFTAMMWASGGAMFGYGILINASIAGGSIITAGRTSLLFASFASITVLLQHAFTKSESLFDPSGYTETGILGATFFATAILAYGLSRRLRSSEELASRHRVDIAKLEKLNELIIQRMNSGVIVADEDDRIRLINKAAGYLLGLPQETTPKSINELSSNIFDDLKKWKANPRDENRVYQSTTSTKGLLAQFTAIGEAGHSEATLIFLEDTARMSQQAQQMKLASIGRLTASIAHEIRNPLSAISHAGQLLAESNNVNEEDFRLTEIIREQSLRVNNVIENILQLSRRKQATPTVFKLQPYLEKFIMQFKLQFDTDIDVQLDVDPYDLEVFMDQTQLNQVLNNLCDNGLRHSEENTGKKTLKIEAALSADSNEPYIKIIDQGKGITAEDENYIFEPFFTTKASGTGLGLYIAKELCEANQARIDYFPVEGGGSCFRLRFKNPEHLQAIPGSDRSNT